MGIKVLPHCRSDLFRHSAVVQTHSLVQRGPRGARIPLLAIRNCEPDKSFIAVGMQRSSPFRNDAITINIAAEH